jgi:hypothetical protein
MERVMSSYLNEPIVEYMIRPEAEIDALQRGQTAHEQPCADEKHHCDRRLHDDQRRAPASRRQSA